MLPSRNAICTSWRRNTMPAVEGEAPAEPILKRTDPQISQIAQIQTTPSICENLHNLRINRRLGGGLALQRAHE
jgi:hypothetical protein